MDRLHRRTNAARRWLYQVLIEPRTHDEQARWRETLLNAVLSAVMAVMVLAVVSTALHHLQTGRWTYPGVYPVAAALFVAALALHRLSRRGHLRATSYWLVATLFLAAEATYAFFGMQVPVAYMASILVLLLANALLGSRVAAAVLVVQCLAWITLFLLEEHGAVHPDTGWMTTPQSAGNFLDYAVPALIIGAVAWASIREPARSVNETLTGNSEGSPLRRLRTRALTIREVQVVQLIATGKTDDQIARELFISVRTVHSHVANAMRKTESVNRTALGVLAVREGIVPLADVDEVATIASGG